VYVSAVTGSSLIRTSARVLALAAALYATPAAAQVPPAADGAGCPVIAFVFIANNSIFDTTDPHLDGRFGWAYRAANALHVRTRESVIRRELLFRVGDCYDEFLLAESERLLRGYDFLSRVDIFGVPQNDGSYHVIVDTRDEWSTQIDVRFRVNGTFGLEGARVQETNLAGTGQTVGAFYFQREVARNYGLSYYTPQLLNSRWDLRADVGRTRAGSFVRQEIAYPFIGEVSRWAARQSLLRDDRFFDYIIPDDDALQRARLLVPIRESFFDLAVVRRTRTRGSATVLGAALSIQDLSFPGAVEMVRGADFDAREPADSALEMAVARQMQPLRNVRAFGIIGQRSIRWVKRRGFDSLRGQQDIALGTEALISIGRSIPTLAEDDDLYTTLTLYTGHERAHLLLVGRGRADGRRSFDERATTPTWQDVYSEAELLAYASHPAIPGQMLLVRAAGAGAWNTTTPFQLTLGGERALRGYAPERLPGGRRLVVNVENRSRFAFPLPEMFDLGSSVFADVGRIWPGDAPFGSDSGWRASIGAGLRAAFPAGSRTTYRIDLAWPVHSGPRFGAMRLLLSVGEVLGVADQIGDLQFLRSRPEGVAGNLVPLP
jgi:hypothetical protein